MPVSDDAPPVSTTPDGMRSSRPASHQFLPRQRQDLVDPRLDDLAEDLPRDLARPSAADARHADHVVASEEARARDAEALLDALRLVERCAQPDRDVVRDVVAA